MSEQVSVVEPTEAEPVTPPVRSVLVRYVCRFAICAIALGYVYYAYALLGPADIEATGRTYLYFWYAAFLSRTFMCHAGLAFAVLAALMLVMRRFRVALACVPIMLVGLGPEVAAFVPSKTDSPAPDFTLMSYNLLFVNERPGPMLDEIREADPDVLVLQEYTPVDHEAFGTALGGVYPYSSCAPAENAFGYAVYSRLPLEHGPTGAPPDRFGELASPRVKLKVEGREIVLYDVHLVPPRRSCLAFMRRQFAALLRDLANESGLVIVAGDFNFNGRSKMNRAMLDLGLTDAHESAGYGRGSTWPAVGRFRHFPGVRIDHVFVSEGLAVTECRVGEARGSDHRPVIVGVHVERG